MARVAPLAAFAAVLLLLLSTAELPVSAADGHCNIADSGLMACLPAVTGTPPEPPTEKCCAALAKADMTCLCKYKNSPALRQLGIDPKQAMRVPALCNVALPMGCQ